MASIFRILRPEPILFILWANELVRLVWSPPVLQVAAGWLMILFVVLSLPHIRRGTAYLCIPLALLAGGLAVYFDQAEGVLRGFQNAAVFMAFFGSIVLLRALAGLAAVEAVELDDAPPVPRAGLRPVLFVLGDSV